MAITLGFLFNIKDFLQSLWIIHVKNEIDNGQLGEHSDHIYVEESLSGFIFLLWFGTIPFESVRFCKTQIVLDKVVVFATKVLLLINHARFMFEKCEAISVKMNDKEWKIELENLPREEILQIKKKK